MAVRIRPTAARAAEAGGGTAGALGTVARALPDGKHIIIGGERTFAFDRVLPGSDTTDALYQELVAPIVESVLQGYHGTVFAYGQTGSGKTFTMNGIVEAIAGHVFPADAMGVDSPIDANGRGHPGRPCPRVTATMMELYNEQLFDLLAGDDVMAVMSSSTTAAHNGEAAGGGGSRNYHNDIDSSTTTTPRTGRSALPLRAASRSSTPRGGAAASFADGSGGDLDGNLPAAVVVGLRQEPVSSESALLRLWAEGNRRRVSATTLMNQRSSRSHLLLTLHVATWVQGGGGGGSGGWRTTKLQLVDLAGSERVKKSFGLGNLTTPDAHLQEPQQPPLLHMRASQGGGGGPLRGGTIRETISINAGLLALGNVITALAKRSKREKQARIGKDAGADPRKKQLSLGGGVATPGDDVTPATGSSVTHIPFRSSKLTRLLQDGLSGNSRTLMIACVSGEEGDFEETLGTLKYAYRAKEIQTRPVFVNIATPTGMLDTVKMVCTLQHRLDEAYRLLAERGIALPRTAEDGPTSPSDPARCRDPPPPEQDVVLCSGDNDEGLSATLGAEVQRLRHALNAERQHSHRLEEDLFRSEFAVMSETVRRKELEERVQTLEAELTARNDANVATASAVSEAVTGVRQPKTPRGGGPQWGSSSENGGVNNIQGPADRLVRLERERVSLAKELTVRLSLASAHITEEKMTPQSGDVIVAGDAADPARAEGKSERRERHAEEVAASLREDIATREERIAELQAQSDHAERQVVQLMEQTDLALDHRRALENELRSVIHGGDPTPAWDGPAATKSGRSPPLSSRQVDQRRQLAASLQARLRTAEMNVADLQRKVRAAALLAKQTAAASRAEIACRQNEVKDMRRRVEDVVKSSATFVEPGHPDRRDESLLSSASEDIARLQGELQVKEAHLATARRQNHIQAVAVSRHDDCLHNDATKAEPVDGGGAQNPSASTEFVSPTKKVGQVRKSTTAETLVGQGGPLTWTPPPDAKRPAAAAVASMATERLATCIAELQDVQREIESVTLTREELSKVLAEAQRARDVKLMQRARTGWAMRKSQLEGQLRDLAAAAAGSRRRVDHPSLHDAMQDAMQDAAIPVLSVAHVSALECELAIAEQRLVELSQLPATLQRHEDEIARIDDVLDSLAARRAFMVRKVKSAHAAMLEVAGRREEDDGKATLPSH